MRHQDVQPLLSRMSRSTVAKPATPRQGNPVALERSGSVGHRSGTPGYAWTRWDQVVGQSVQGAGPAVQIQSVTQI